MQTKIQSKTMQSETKQSETKQIINSKTRLFLENATIFEDYLLYYHYPLLTDMCALCKGHFIVEFIDDKYEQLPRLYMHRQGTISWFEGQDDFEWFSKWSTFINTSNVKIVKKDDIIFSDYNYVATPSYFTTIVKYNGGATTVEQYHSRYEFNFMTK